MSFEQSFDYIHFGQPLGSLMPMTMVAAVLVAAVIVAVVLLHKARLPRPKTLIAATVALALLAGIGVPLLGLHPRQQASPTDIERFVALVTMRSTTDLGNGSYLIGSTLCTVESKDSGDWSPKTDQRTYTIAVACD